MGLLRVSEGLREGLEYIYRPYVPCKVWDVAGCAYACMLVLCGRRGLALQFELELELVCWELCYPCRLQVAMYEMRRMWGRPVHRSSFRLSCFSLNWVSPKNTHLMQMSVIPIPSFHFPLTRSPSEGPPPHRIASSPKYSSSDGACKLPTCPQQGSHKKGAQSCTTRTSLPSRTSFPSCASTCHAIQLILHLNLINTLT
jgi:hypothetical protein